MLIEDCAGTYVSDTDYERWQTLADVVETVRGVGRVAV